MPGGGLEPLSGPRVVAGLRIREALEELETGIVWMGLPQLLRVRHHSVRGNPQSHFESHSHHLRFKLRRRGGGPGVHRVHRLVILAKLHEHPCFQLQRPHIGGKFRQYVIGRVQRFRASIQTEI